MKKYTHVIIDRKKWSRGNLSGNALLVNRAFRNDLMNVAPMPKIGRMCCLGFACLVLGATRKEISGETMPSTVEKELPGLNYRNGDTSFSKQASAINDNPDITDKEREKQLKKLARENGFIFKFVN